MMQLFFDEMSTHGAVGARGLSAEDFLATSAVPRQHYTAFHRWLSAQSGAQMRDKLAQADRA